MSLLLETDLGDLVIDLDIPNPAGCRYNDIDGHDVYVNYDTATTQLQRRQQQQQQQQCELCKNILKLAKVRYYTNTLIYRIIPNRGIAMMGCPIGNGTGGTSIYGLLDFEAFSNNKNGDGEDNNNNNSNNDDEDDDLYYYYERSLRRFMKSDCGRMLTSSEKREKGRVVACPVVVTKGMGVDGVSSAEQHHVPDTIGSQFMITLDSGQDRALDGYQYDMIGGSAATKDNNEGESSSSSSSFLSLGVVVEDDNDVLGKLSRTYCDDDGRPYADIRIKRILVIHDPFDDPPNMKQLLQRRNVVEVEDEAEDAGEIENKGKVNGNSNRRIIDSPSPVRPAEEAVPVRISCRDIAASAVDNDDDDDDEEKLRRRRIEEDKEQDIAKKKEDRSRAVVLEMLGDLPDANVRVPENTLFVCKLNPITEDEDLELIFGRFEPSGNNVRVNIIRDHITGHSLQYGFVEFSNPQSAITAYFKMNNVLIDDRRIKVDFSQSVSHLWDKYNQKMRNNRNNNNNNSRRIPSGLLPQQHQHHHHHHHRDIVREQVPRSGPAPDQGRGRSGQAHEHSRRWGDGGHPARPHPSSPSQQQHHHKRQRCDSSSTGERQSASTRAEHDAQRRERQVEEENADSRRDDNKPRRQKRRREGSDEDKEEGDRRYRRRHYHRRDEDSDGGSASSSSSSSSYDSRDRRSRKRKKKKRKKKSKDKKKRSESERRHHRRRRGDDRSNHREDDTTDKSYDDDDNNNSDDREDNGDHRKRGQKKRSSSSSSRRKNSISSDDKDDDDDHHHGDRKRRRKEEQRSSSSRR